MAQYAAAVDQGTTSTRFMVFDHGGQDRFRARTGLPIATYFSGPKIKWILDNVDGIREQAESGDIVFGNIDSWVIWQLTGGPNGGVHVTDVTNASRTMMMSLETLDWDDEILGILNVPRAMLPEIRASSEVYGEDRKSTRLNSSHVSISYAVFCLKK